MYRSDKIIYKTMISKYQKVQTCNVDRNSELEQLTDAESLLLECEHLFNDNNGWKPSTDEIIDKTAIRVKSVEDDIRHKYEKVIKLKDAVKRKHEKVIKLRDTVTEEKNDLKSKIEAFEQEKTDMQQLHNIQENVITLNVGGQIYTTSKSTLCSQKESMLAAMFSGHHKLEKMENGSYFIDADGKHFGIILNYLRGRIIYSTDLLEDRKTLMELEKEADFYNLVRLKDLVGIRLKRFRSVAEEMKQEFIDSRDGNKYETKKKINFERGDFSNCCFENITFRHEADFNSANLINTNFSGCTFLKNVSFKNAELIKSNFSNCEVGAGVSICLDGANLHECDFGFRSYTDWSRARPASKRFMESISFNYASNIPPPVLIENSSRRRVDKIVMHE